MHSATSSALFRDVVFQGSLQPFHVKMYSMATENKYVYANVHMHIDTVLEIGSSRQSDLPYCVSQFSVIQNT
jgi:hypothetical protein